MLRWGVRDTREAAVGAEVRRLRRARGWTQERLAEKAALSTYFIGEVERGQTHVSVRSLCQLADALGVRAADLLPAQEPSRDALAKALASELRFATREELDALLRLVRALRAR
jgi:transcriptional regulator with XRE-family HTH domain